MQNESLINKIFKASFLIHFVLVVSVVALFGLGWYLLDQVRLLSSKDYKQQVVQNITTNPNTNQIDEDQIRKIVSEAVATLSATPQETTKEIVTTKVITQTTPRTTFIPMGSGSTTSTTWTDVSDSEVYIDLENDFSKTAYITFEGNLKVAHGNGQAFIRLYDATNKIAVNGSELTTSDNADYKQVISGKLTLWKGRNLYKVQIKSLNGFEVTYSGGKIKVVY